MSATYMESDRKGSICTSSSSDSDTGFTTLVQSLHEPDTGDSVRDCSDINNRPYLISNDTNDITKSITKQTRSRKDIFSSMPRFLKSYRMVLCFELITIILTVILVVRSRASSGHYAPSAERFFPRHSLVSDFYEGQLTIFNNRLLTSDLSFVFYYAPWDRQCQDLRVHFNQLARYYYEQVSFLGVNCWQPNSECRRQYKIRSYPALVLYIRSDTVGDNAKVITYEGPLEVGHISRFLSRVLRPFSHVTCHADLARLQLEHNGVVVSHYNLSKSSERGFRNFYIASIMSLQFDHNLAITWGVVTDPRVARALVLSPSSIHLILWNTTLALKETPQLDSLNLVRWVKHRFDVTAGWLVLPGTKSLTINNLLKKGPLLLLFAPDNPYMKVNDPFTMLRCISLEYSNCENSSRVRSLAGYLASHSSQGRNHLRTAERVCRDYIQQNLQAQQVHQTHHTDVNEMDDECCCGTSHNNLFSSLGMVSSNTDTSYSNRFGEGGIVQMIQRWMSGPKDACQDMLLSVSSSSSSSSRQSGSQCNCNNRSSQSNDQHSSSSSSSSFMESDIHHTEPSIWNMSGPIEDDHIERMRRYNAEEECKRLLLSSRLSPPVLLRDHHSSVNISGLSCETNKSLTLMAVDSLHHGDLAQRLGINLTVQEPANTAAVILDPQQEIHFVLNMALSHRTLVYFILNYTNGLLDRGVLKKRSEIKDKCDSEEICVQDLNLEEYLKLMEEPGKAAVVMHYTATCGSCTGTSHVFLAVTKALSHIRNLTFARIDVGINILPWHLNFPTVPTIIFHPKYHKSETRIFDSRLELNFKNLLSFLAANLEVKERLSLALLLCTGECKDKVISETNKEATILQQEDTINNGRLLRCNTRLMQLLPDISTDSSNYESQLQYQDLLRQKLVLGKRAAWIRPRLLHLSSIIKQYKQLALSHNGDFHGIFDKYGSNVT